MFSSRTDRENRPASSTSMLPTDAKSMATQHFYSRRQLATPITILSDEGEELITVFSVPRYPSDVRQRLKAENPAAYQELVREQAAHNCRSHSCTNAENPTDSCRSFDNCQNRAGQRSQKSQFQTQKTPISNPIPTQSLASEPGDAPSNLDRQTPITDNIGTANAQACTTRAPECGDHPMTVRAQS